MSEDQELSHEITRVLESARVAGTSPVDELVPLLYDRLRTLARGRLRALGAGHTLDTTALVHELYIKLADGGYQWDDRNHFLCAAAVAMRHILVDEARRRAAQRRGASPQKVTLGDMPGEADQRALEILDLERALESLAARDERLARIAVLRFYGGLTVPEAARALEMSERTLKREWRKARALLHVELERGAHPPHEGVETPPGTEH